MYQKTSYKCTLLGDFGLSSFLLSSHSASLGAGKSSLLLRIAYDKFGREFEPTIGVEFGLKKFNVNGNDIKLQIWDTVRNLPLWKWAYDEFRMEDSDLQAFPQLSTEV